jgi:hypothetical protein
LTVRSVCRWFRPPTRCWTSASISSPINCTGLANQLANAFVQPAQHLSHWEHHLDGGIPVGGHCLELLHRPLRIDLIWFLHVATLLFFGKKFP